MSEKFITETYLRDNFSLGWGTELHLPLESKLTPSASQLINERKIKVKFMDADGRVYVPKDKSNTIENVKRVHPLTDSDQKPEAQICGLCNQKIDNKSDVLTWLDSDSLVPKNHPRITFRGKLDTMISYAVLVQCEFESFTGAQIIKNFISDLRSFMGNVLRSEVKNEELQSIHMGRLDEKTIHILSHNPLKYLGHDHIVPESTFGRWVALINYLRALVREAEVAASQIYIDPGMKVLRPDILNGLNRLSSALYVIMIMIIISDNNGEIKLPEENLK
ncbi:MAG: ethanolamine utilization cob(I)yrinic acid a,c-diamide adenosyltransferase EutT [Ignavibacteriae bacterium HGW-Ignavibacteriae-2]|nr:MAG: ethanolamine utilization cob(I)yrinic acid a,c-diamide adenosyltransferase EutT [Ignavibacteriae bacterium HGW-Ignavibacteriae-2]